MYDIRRFDIYRKVPKDLTQPTLAGAIVSISCCAFIIFLFLAELSAFISPSIESSLSVQDPVEYERIPVNLKIILFNMDCEMLGLDIQDQSGRHEVGFIQNVKKAPYEHDNGKGCYLAAQFHINKVPGNFHLSTHAYRHTHAHGGNKEGASKIVDMTHAIETLTFGHSNEFDRKGYDVQGSFDPLQHKAGVNGSSVIHEYILKIVPAVFHANDGTFYPYQYTFAYRAISAAEFGAVDSTIWFRYDLTPITVSYKVTRKPFYHFLTTICAIIGGTFTVAGIVDSAIFTASEAFRKWELGKTN